MRIQRFKESYHKIYNDRKLLQTHLKQDAVDIMSSSIGHMIVH